MNTVPKNPLINIAQQCMVRPIDQKHIRNQEPMFVRQLDLIEVKDDDDILEAIKRKFQADANRQQWIRDRIVGIEELDVQGEQPQQSVAELCAFLSAGWSPSRRDNRQEIHHLPPPVSAAGCGGEPVANV